MGGDFTLALSTTGDLWAWGRNDKGQLGDGTWIDRATPVPVLLPQSVRITKFVAGAGHSLVLTSDNQIWTWGDNSSGQLGDGTMITSSVPSPINTGGSIIT